MIVTQLIFQTSFFGGKIGTLTLNQMTVSKLFTMTNTEVEDILPSTILPSKPAINRLLQIGMCNFANDKLSGKEEINWSNKTLIYFFFVLIEK